MYYLYMKLSRYFFFYILPTIFLFPLCLSCQSPKKEPSLEEPPIQIAEPETIPEPEPPIPEPEPPAEVDNEYERSTKALEQKTAVSKDTFEEDKKQILGIIDTLSKIMSDKDFPKWLTYVEPDSVDYWSKRVNLNRASTLLPIKGLQLKSISDYFLYVFIPSRSNHSVTEIRYISPEYVKAVQVREKNDIIYYYFVKQDGKWLIRLPKFES